jgi:hypothetical protein
VSQARTSVANTRFRRKAQSSRRRDAGRGGAVVAPAGTMAREDDAVVAGQMARGGGISVASRRKSLEPLELVPAIRRDHCVSRLRSLHRLHDLQCRSTRPPAVQLGCVDRAGQQHPQHGLADRGRAHFSLSLPTGSAATCFSPGRTS